MFQRTNKSERIGGANRGSFAFLAGLVVTASIAVSHDDWGRFMQDTRLAKLPQSAARAPAAARDLSAQEWQAAATAWAYFDTHFRAGTGFVDAIHDHPSATLWDQGSYVLALVAAHGLGVIDEATLAYRSEAFLQGLERLPLFEDTLPNKAYDTRDLRMVDYANVPAPDGIGWSALDVARLLMALRVLEVQHPQYGAQIRGIIARWDLSAMAVDGRLWGTSRADGHTRYHQEGRIGYEQYGARAAALWGLDVLVASTAQPIMDWRRVSGVEVAVDRRRAKDFGAITPVLSEPYLLQAFEMGLNVEGRLLADRLYQAQEARARDSGVATIVSEDHIDQAPHFLYNSVFGNGVDWAVVSEDGDLHPELRTVSLKASFGWDALYDTDYTDEVLEGLQDAASPRGWYAGRYEADGRINTALTLNTNAVVLEALHYKSKGPLLQIW